MAEDELKALMRELIEGQNQVIKGQNQLLDAFQKDQPKKKDRWDKFSTISTFISGFLLTLLALGVSIVYAAHDNALKSIQAVGQFMPYLTSENQAKRDLALLLVSKITNPGRLAIDELPPILGGLRVVRTVASTGDEREAQAEIETQAASEGLAKSALYGEGEDKKLATEAIQRVLKESNFLFTGLPGETIKVEIISEKKPVSFYAYLDKKKLEIKDSPFTFDLGNSHGQASYLFITTSGDIGDVYKVQISGNSANKPSLKQIIRQTEKETTHTFLFKIE